jgi:hypothetical protein
MAGYAKAKEANEDRQAKKKFLYGGDYARKAQTIRQNATTCFMCGGVFTPDNPPQADHLYPELGHKSPLAPTHGTCNRSKGNDPYTPPTPPNQPRIKKNI